MEGRSADTHAEEVDGPSTPVARDKRGWGEVENGSSERSLSTEFSKVEYSSMKLGSGSIAALVLNSEDKDEYMLPSEIAKRKALRHELRQVRRMLDRQSVRASTCLAWARHVLLGFALLHSTPTCTTHQALRAFHSPDSVPQPHCPPGTSRTNALT